mgnify:CR=1 FL=1
MEEMQTNRQKKTGRQTNRELEEREGQEKGNKSPLI